MHVCLDGRCITDHFPGIGRYAYSLAGALAWGMESAGLADPLVVCGDYSADRGSGTVPAALAALTGLPQALGLVSAVLAEPAADGVDGSSSPARIRVQRRLDGARREELLVSPPAVVSVEGSVARLRRAPLVEAVRWVGDSGCRRPRLFVRRRAIVGHAGAGSQFHAQRKG